MKKVLSLFMLILIISCCAKTYLQTEVDSFSQIEGEVHSLELPKWFLEVPQANEIAYSFQGISRWERDSLDASLRDKASVRIARNRSCIVVSKTKMRHNSKDKNQKLVEFDVQVTNDVEQLQTIYDNSKVLAKHEFKNIALGMVGLSDNGVELDTSLVVVKEAPSWLGQVVVDGTQYISSGKGTAINPTEAYNRAYEDAIEKLAASFDVKVNNLEWQENLDVGNFGEINNSKVIRSIINTKNSLMLRFHKGSYVYDAFVEIKWNKCSQERDSNKEK